MELTRDTAGRKFALVFAESAAGRDLADVLVESATGHDLAMGLAYSAAGQSLARELAGSAAGRELARGLVKSAAGQYLARELTVGTPGQHLARELAGNRGTRDLAKRMAESDEQVGVGPVVLTVIGLPLLLAVLLNEIGGVAATLVAFVTYASGVQRSDSDDHPTLDRDETDPDLVPVEAIRGIAAVDYRNAVEPVLGHASYLLQEGVVESEHQERLLKTNVEWLQARILGNLEEGVSAQAVAPIFFETAAIVQAHIPVSGNDQLDEATSQVIKATTVHQHNDIDLPHVVADKIEEVTGGQVSRRTMLWAIATGNTTLAIGGLLADVGLHKTATVSGATLLVSTLTVIGLIWRDRNSPGS